MKTDLFQSCGHCWIFIGRTDAETEAPILWPPDAKNWLTGKDPDARKDWRQEETKDEMVGWHHRLNGNESEQSPGVGDGQGSLVCCSPWGHKESDMTEQMNWRYCTGLMLTQWCSQRWDQTQVSCICRQILYHLSHQGNAKIFSEMILTALLPSSMVYCLAWRLEGSAPPKTYLFIFFGEMQILWPKMSLVVGQKGCFNKTS